MVDINCLNSTCYKTFRDVQKNTSSSMANRFDSSRPAGLTFFQFFELIYDIYNRIWDDFGDGVSQFFSSE